MAWRPVARACLVGVGWWRWTARVADSGRAGALTVVWPAGLRAAYVSQPACAARGTLAEAPWIHMLYGPAVHLDIWLYSTVVHLYGTTARLYGLYSEVP